ncbi:GMP synthase [glutamine-hydrolyzing] subunit A [uncultured archaeon]|nr:GMP synthase [glutamine-hydrolyzing] subunit A [uncultured archaeon]
MIFLISTCSEPFHNLEFVKTIEKILIENKIQFATKHYSKLTGNDLKKADKLIICGTSLRDNEFVKEINKFQWVTQLNKPILGICAGMQIISSIFGAKLGKSTEIGFYEENFTKEFLSLKGEHEVYHLHNNYTTLPIDFISFTKSKIPQAIKHKTKEIYGVLFHPEVRNKVLIEEFIKL